MARYRGSEAAAVRDAVAEVKVATAAVPDEQIEQRVDGAVPESCEQPVRLAGGRSKAHVIQSEL